MFLQDLTEPFERLVVTRLEREHTANIAERALVIVVEIINERPPVPGLCIIGLQLHRRIQKLHRQVAIALRNADGTHDQKLGRGTGRVLPDLLDSLGDGGRGFLIRSCGELGVKFIEALGALLGCCRRPLGLLRWALRAIWANFCAGRARVWGRSLPRLLRIAIRQRKCRRTNVGLVNLGLLRQRMEGR